MAEPTTGTTIVTDHRTPPRGVLPRGLPFTSVPTRDVAVPHWLPALLLSLAPARRLVRRLQCRRRARAGLCPRCGYDLRATRDRCPECGAAGGVAGGG